MKEILKYVILILPLVINGQLKPLHSIDLNSFPSYPESNIDRRDIVVYFQELDYEYWSVYVDSNKLFQYGFKTQFPSNRLVRNSYFNDSQQLVFREKVQVFDEDDWKADIAQIRSLNYDAFRKIESPRKYSFNFYDEIIEGDVVEEYMGGGLFYEIPSNSYLLKIKSPITNKKGKIKGYKYYTAEVWGAREDANKSKYSREQLQDLIKTDFESGDLRNANLLYDLKKYILMFIEELTIPKYQRRKSLQWVVGSKGELSKSFDLNLPKSDSDVLKSILADDRIIIEYAELEGDQIALSVGNIFEGDDFRIIVDPLKFSSASPEKRAYIMWHECYHSLGLKHGECGKLMFPYADEDYDWIQWGYDTATTYYCFLEKRNNQ